MGSGAAAVGIITAVSALVGAGAAVYSSTRKPNKPKIEAPPEIPEFTPPGIDPAEAKRKKLGRASTLLTRPSSLSEASTFKPTLLGQ